MYRDGSFTKCFPSGISMPFYHKHRENEELYIFVKGQGEFKIDDEILEIKEGTVIRVAQEGKEFGVTIQVNLSILFVFKLGQILWKKVISRMVLS